MTTINKNLTILINLEIILDITKASYSNIQLKLIPILAGFISKKSNMLSNIASFVLLLAVFLMIVTSAEACWVFGTCEEAKKLCTSRWCDNKMNQ